MKIVVVLVQAFLLSSCGCLMVDPAGSDEEKEAGRPRRNSSELLMRVRDLMTNGALAEVIRRAMDPESDVGAPESDVGADGEDGGAEPLRESEEVADDPKSDVTAHAKNERIVRPWEHHVLTWNAKGHAPTAEVLGGDWMSVQDGIYSDLEILTGVLLFRAAGCDVDFAHPAFQRYEKRYAEMYKRYEAYEKYHGYADEVSWDEQLASMKFKYLLYGLTRAVEKFTKASSVVLEPTWVHKCSVKEVIRDNLGLCAKETSKMEEACPFTLRSEGCWKARAALPVYGYSFMHLLHRRNFKPKFWEYYLKGLAAQVSWGEGCHVDNTTEGRSTPGSHIRAPAPATPEQLAFEEWSMTAAWDALLIKLTSMATALLVKMNVRTQGAVTGLLSVRYIQDDQVRKAVNGLMVAGMLPDSAPRTDVAFFQQAGLVDVATLCDHEDCAGFNWRRSSLDTVVCVREGFGGGIDEEDTQYAEAVWDTMTQALRGGCEDAGGEEANSSRICTKVTFPEGLLEMLSPAQRENRVDFDALAGRKHVTIVVTRSNPKLLLLSVHADEAGFLGPMYLNLAKKLYDGMAAEHSLSGMYIGTSASLQQNASHGDFSEKRGFSFEQFQKMVPEGMHMFAPTHRTISKVRTFLQPPFDHTAKEELQVTDVLLEYPTAARVEFRSPSVVNNVVDGVLGMNPDETAHYPTNTWPAEHFMVSASFDSLETVRTPPEEVGRQLGDDLLRDLA